MKKITDIPKKGKLYSEVAELSEALAYGKVFTVDPSIGSSSSSPAYAIYQQGILSDSGTIFTGGSHLPLWQRARNLGIALHDLTSNKDISVLVYEDIPASSGFNQNAVASLLKAVGIVLACTRSTACLGVHPASWKNYVRPEYVKGDEQDAIEIGYIVTTLATYIEAAKEVDRTGNTVPNRGSRRRK